MIQIERIRMHLPPGFEHRAATIARRIGEALARASVAQDVVIENLSVTPQRLRVHSSDEEVAQVIVNEIIATYTGGQK